MDPLSLIPQFGSLIYTLLAFVVALSVIVAIHEYGHYIVGRWSGIKADVFSLGFGPVLYSRVDRHGTKWQFALLPFGGYVKFRGDANAASGKDGEAMSNLSPEELRATMHGAPLWARAATVAAGPVFNFILSILVFAAIMMSRGVASDPLTVGELMPLPQQHELRVGDVLVEIGGIKVPNQDDAGGFDEILASNAPAAVVDYAILRNGDSLVVEGPYPFPPLIGQVAPQSAAYDIGLQAGDVIVELEGAPIYAFEQLRTVVESSNGRALALKVWRDAEVLDLVAYLRTTEPIASR